MIHAGLWNKGAGENCRYGKEYAGMEGIVKSTLNTEGYPEINLDNAEKILADEKDGPYEMSKNYPGNEKYKLIKDYYLTGDHNASYGEEYQSDNIQNLSKTVIGL